MKNPTALRETPKVEQTSTGSNGQSDHFEAIREALSPGAWNFLGMVCEKMQVPGPDVEDAFELRALVRRIVKAPDFQARLKAYRKIQNEG